MIRKSMKVGGLGLAVAMIAAPSIASAAPITLHRDTVIPVVFETTLTMKGNRVGDRFTARVDDNRDLPSGTRFEGRIRALRGPRDREPGMVDLEFTDIVLPNGQRTRIDAVPITMNDRYVRRDRDGRFTVNKDARNREGYVIGGAIGGFVLGSIFKKQFEGVVLGTLAGILMAENDRKNDGNTIITRGQKLGALINRDVRLEYDGYGRDDRWGRDDDWRRDDRWDNRRDDRWDDRRDDRWNDRREDRWDDRFDDRNVVIRVNDRDLRFSRERAYRQGGTTMVPLEAAATQMRIRVSRDETRTDRYWFLEGTDGYLQVEVNSREARLNGRWITLSQSVVERDRVVYVPIDALAAITRDTISVNGTRISRPRI